MIDKMNAINYMRKTFLFSMVFALFSVCNSLHAQQWHYYNPTSWFDVNAVEIPGPGLISIGGGQETRDSVQIMFQSSDYGLTWHENNHDGLAPWNKSIAFSDLLNGYGVGYDGRIIKSNDAGLNWGWPAIPINRDFNKIIYAGRGTYFVAGGNKTNDSIQTILKSTDYGNTWNVIFDTLGPWLKSIYFIDTLKGFAVGDNGVILSTTNGGNTWTSVTAPILRDFNAIAFINADTGYITGGTPSGLCRRTILRTVNGGANWSVLTDIPGGILKDISLADALVGYCVGDSATILKTIDGGLNWLPIIIDTNMTGNETFNAVKFYNRNFGAVGGKAGVVYVYRDAPVEVYTLGSSLIGTMDATLTGGINTHTKNASYSFIYSNSISFTISDSTQGINVCNDSLWIVSKHIAGLTPNTTYYYFLKAFTASDTIHGDTLSFYTGFNDSFDFQTLDATMVGAWSADLNGYINKSTAPVALSFEYGDSPAFGSEIAANPVTVDDTLMHYVRTHISNLQANKWCFYRLKGVTASGIYYGDTKIFHAIDLPYVFTEHTSDITLTSVRLNGRVSTNLPVQAVVKFEYGWSPGYGTEVAALPDTISGPGNFSTFCILTGLSPVITYHYRMKVITQSGISYGEDRIFITGGPLAYTCSASDFGVNSVRLNGAVNANGFTTAIWFEYGLTDLYGNEIVAVPDTVTGTTNVSAEAVIAGLSPATTYHYRIKAANANERSYGADMTFVLGSPFVSSLSASNVRAFSAQLNGIVNANGFPTAIKFEYGTTPGYGHEVTAIPDSASGTGNINIYYQLSGLLPDTTYHFRVKAMNSIGSSYSNDIAFTIYKVLPTATTQLANDISFHSARLNATVNPHQNATAIKFEYGLTSSYGNEINAIPASSSDSVDLSVYSDPDNLLSNTYYHFRVKVVTLYDTVFGNDMIFFTGQSEIPNFDFEIWDSLSIDLPDGWTQGAGLVTKYSPGCDGNFAIKLQNTPDRGMSGVTLGIIGDGVFDQIPFSGGAPFNARPDSLTGCFNYNIDSGDTAWIILAFKKGGIPVSMNIYNIFGNSGGNFVSLNFPIQYETSDIPDTIVLMMLSSNLNQRIHPPGSWLIADDIHFTGTSVNIPGSSFELWHTEKGIDLPSWYYSAKGMIPNEILNSGVVRTTDAVSNNYAVMLITTSQAAGGMNSGNEIFGKFPVFARHQSLTGYYKFFPMNNDTMSISIIVYKNGADIGRGGFIQWNSISSYTPFITDIIYTGPTEIPDSASISINAYNGPPCGNSVLYIDNLNFDGFLSGIKETPLPASDNFDFNVYPNPFSDQATVSFTMNREEHVKVRLFDISGKQVVLLADCKYDAGNYKLDLSAQGLQKGFYICVINTEGQALSRKLIVY